MLGSPTVRTTIALYSFGIVASACLALVVGSGPAVAVPPTAGVVAASSAASAAAASAASTSLAAASQQLSLSQSINPWGHGHGHGQGPGQSFNHRRGTAAPTDHSLADVTLGNNPLSIALDPATHTAYVTNFNDNTVSIVDTAKCNDRNVSECVASAATVNVTPSPFWAEVDVATNTVYVAGFGSNFVSVINGRTCNATDTSGCSTPPQSVTVGDGPDGLAINQKTDTIYVANNGPGGDYSGNTVSVIDGATCNSSVTSGCGLTPPVVTVGLGPGTPSVDELTNTIYVPNTNFGGIGSVSVINGATCDATITTGCGQTTATMAVGPTAYDLTVDPATDTVYEPTFSSVNSPTLILNGATCNGTIHTGCAQTPSEVPGGAGADQALVDPATGNVFILNQEDSTISVIDGQRCNAIHSAGCVATPVLIGTEYDPGAMALDLATQTLYETNQDENTMSVLNATFCTDAHQADCRHEAPTSTIGSEPAGIANNPVTNTIYVSNRADETLSVVDGTKCNASNTAGCRASWPTATVGGTPQAVVVNTKTDTIYTANFNGDTGTGNTVSVINGATCNRFTTSGCSGAPVVLTVGNNPVTLAVNEATDTIYVTNQADHNVSVINGATCNGTVHSGCGAAFPVVSVGLNPSFVYVDQATNTVYVSNGGGTNTVSVIDGATCDAQNTSGCGLTPPTTTVGNTPGGLAANPATHTLYALNFGDSTVSVINEATCNANVLSGCTTAWPTMNTGPMALIETALDQQTNQLFVPTIADSGVDIFALANCNAENSTGCAAPPKLVPTGGWPTNVTYDPRNSTVYVSNNVDGTFSLFAPSGAS
jgi:DNA-binding beta-propeller fold protein YncE